MTNPSRYEGSLSPASAWITQSPLGTEGLVQVAGFNESGSTPGRKYLGPYRRVSDFPCSIRVIPRPPKPEPEGRKRGTGKLSTLPRCRVKLVDETQLTFRPWIGVTPSTTSTPLLLIWPPLKIWATKPVVSAGVRLSSRLVVRRR